MGLYLSFKMCHSINIPALTINITDRTIINHNNNTFQLRPGVQKKSGFPVRIDEDIMKFKLPKSAIIIFRNTDTT